MSGRYRRNPVPAAADLPCNIANRYPTAVLPQWDMFPAVLRGKIRLKGSSATNPVAVGDVVEFEAGDPAVITAVRPRTNYIIRKSTNLSRQSHIIASNLDRAFLVVTLLCVTEIGNYLRKNVSQRESVL